MGKTFTEGESICIYVMPSLWNKIFFLLFNFLSFAKVEYPTFLKKLNFSFDCSSSSLLQITEIKSKEGVGGGEVRKSGRRATIPKDLGARCWGSVFSLHLFVWLKQRTYKKWTFKSLMTQWLRAHPILAEDQNSGPSTHPRQLTAVCNFQEDLTPLSSRHRT